MTEAMSCMEIYLLNKMTFMVMQSILLATFLHGQFIHHTEISLHPNTNFDSKPVFMSLSDTSVYF